MFYAIFGIPLTLFTVANLGSIMATSFRFVYKFICCGLCCLCCRCNNCCCGRTDTQSSSSSSSPLWRQKSASSSVDITRTGRGRRWQRRRWLREGRPSSAEATHQGHDRTATPSGGDQLRRPVGSSRGKSKQHDIEQLVADNEDGGVDAAVDCRQRGPTELVARRYRSRVEMWRCQLARVFAEPANIDKATLHCLQSLLYLTLVVQIVRRAYNPCR